MTESEINAWREGAKFALTAVVKADLMFISDKCMAIAIERATADCIAERDRFVSGKEAPIPVSEAMQLARMWGDGVLIAGDESAVRAALLAEVERQSIEIIALKRDVMGYWETVHSEFCTNVKTCDTYGGNKQCHCPPPDYLKVEK